jgi:polygalacturonase
MSGGVEDVLFEDLTSTSESGIRISAELLRGGFVRTVTFRNMTFDWNALLKKTFLLEVRVRRVRGAREREREREQDLV